MRRFHAFLLAAGLVAAPAGAVASPSTPSTPWGQANPDVTMFEKLEWSSSKAKLGVLVMSLSPELRTFFGSTDKTGVLVARVEPGSAAARAGIAVGDVIVGVQDAKIDDAGDVISALSNVKDKAKLRLLRDKKPMTLDVTLDATTQSGLPLAPFKWLRDLFDRSDRDSST